MTDVGIEYHVSYGFLDRAEQLQHTLPEQFGDRLDRIALVTGDHGVLTATVDDERIWDKSEDELGPDLVLRRACLHAG